MMANIKIKNKKVLAVIIAFAMVMTMVAPVTVLAAWPWDTDTQAAGQDTQSAGAVQSVEDFEPINVSGFYTNKTVVPGSDDKYHIKLVANNGSAALVNQTPIDIGLLLDTSAAMNKTLYTRNLKNLQTHAIFEKVMLSKTNNNALYDEKNPNNDSGISITTRSTYYNNKYIEDPTSPGTYVYLCQMYKKNWQGLLGNRNYYVYYFTTSTGVTYMSNVITETLADTSIGDLVGGAFGTGNINSLTFTPESNDEGLTSFTTDCFYARKDGSEKNSSLNKLLYEEAIKNPEAGTDENGPYGILYIYDDNFVLRKVYVRKTTEQVAFKSLKCRYEYHMFSESFFVDPVDSTTTSTTYTYSYFDDGGVEHIIQQTNDIYGSDYGVFQGFHFLAKDKNGNYIRLNDGTYKIDHSIGMDSRSLYAYANNINVSRMDALKEAVENFILRVHRDCYDKGAQVRIGVVSFATDQTVLYGIKDITGTTIFGNTTIGADGINGTNVDLAKENTTADMIDKIYQIQAKGNAAELDDGMTGLSSILQNTAHKRYGVVFTDAVPATTDFWRSLATSSTNGFNITIANNAISTAKKMKDKGVQMYTVGLFDDSNVNQLYGDAFYYREGAAWGADNYPCSGAVRSVWGRTDAASWTGREIDPINTAACNRMLNYISNNFTTANSLGVTAMSWFDAPGSILQQLTKTGVQGFKISQNFPRKDSKYYYPVTVSKADASSLYKAFDFLAKEMEAPSSKLGNQTKIFDTVTDYFTLDKNSVDAYYQTGDSSGSEVGINWAGKFRDGIEIKKTDNSVTAWGVDFYEYYGSKARRLVVEFDVTRKPDFIGGNLVNTNGTNSGVYDGTDGKMLLVENFNVPLQNMDLRYNIESADQGVYYSYEANLDELIDTTKIDGINNAFTTLVYTIYDGSNAVATYTIKPGETLGKWNINDKVAEEVLKLHPIITQDKTYHVVCKVTSNQDKNGSVQTINPETDATFYVFTPEITVADGTTSYGKTEDVSPVNVTWKSVSNSDAEAPFEAAPVLTYTIKTKDGQTVENPAKYYFTAETDFTVVDVKIPQSTFLYEVLESETKTDENGKTDTVEVYKPHEAPRGGVPLAADSGLVSFKHLAVGAEEATAADTGDYNWSLKRFKLVIGTEFAGDYANPEDVTYTVTDEDGNEVGKAEFKASDFTGLKANQTIEIDTYLAPGKNYTVTKTFGAEKYIVTFTATDANGKAVMDADSNNTVFDLNYDGQTETVNLFITNTFDEHYNPPVSGVDGGTNLAKLVATIMFVLAGILGVGEVSYIAYLRIRS